MPSPFPGMDSYLEAYWGDIHTRLMANASRQINAQLPDDMQARVEEGLRVTENGIRDGTIYPDVFVVETPNEGASGQRSASTVQVAEPCVLMLDEVPTPRHIEIVDLRDDGRIITVIEILSRSNKVGLAGIRAYRSEQRDCLDAGMKLVEIDLLREGNFVLAVPEEPIPIAYRTPYRICVRRASDLQRIEIYRAPLREPLPNIPIPLRPSDADIILQLQPLIDECYWDGRYERLNYGVAPRPALSPDDAAWAEEIIGNKRLMSVASPQNKNRTE